MEVNDFLNDHPEQGDHLKMFKKVMNQIIKRSTDLLNNLYKHDADDGQSRKEDNEEQELEDSDEEPEDDE